MKHPAVGAIYVIALAFLVQAHMLAQTTWRDLRFGMTEAQVKAQLGNVRRPAPDEEADSHRADYAGWEIPIEVESIPGRAAILFDKKTHRCTGVTLFLDPTKLASRVKKISAVKALLESLENKYGDPFRTEDGVLAKSTTWRTEDQIIECSVVFVEDLPRLILISYRPKSKDV